MEQNDLNSEKLNGKIPYSPPKTVKIAQRPKKAQRAQDSIDRQIDKISKNCGEISFSKTKNQRIQEQIAKRKNASEYNKALEIKLACDGLTEDEIRIVKKKGNIFYKRY